MATPQADASLDSGADIATLDDAADASDTTSHTCESAVDCPQSESPCLSSVCDDGTCTVAPLPGEMTCLTAGLCPAPGICSAGTCKPQGAACDDNNPCTADQCISTGCNYVVFPKGTPCQTDGLACTSEQCESGKCTAAIVGGWCFVDGACAKVNESSPGEACAVCDPSQSLDSWTVKTEGVCDDNNPCTTETECTSAGTCGGEPVQCSDNNVCTDDSCLPVTGCVHLSNAATCTDNDPCTSGGGCEDGGCVFKTSLQCDDANPCTADSCAKGFGCVYAPQEATCAADADPCTDDVCLSGACVAVPSISVCKVGGTCVPAGGKASGNPCLVCKPAINAKAWTQLDNSSCDDGNLCTIFDTCTKGSCSGELVTCDDNNGCTKDACQPKAGCTFIPQAGPCNDGNACTSGDACLGGHCKGTSLSPQDCADDNPCTTDGCIAISGCVHVPHNKPCDDDDPCTKADFCTAGSCVAGKMVCPCEFNDDCNDGNPCTIDTCVTGVGCSNTPKSSGSTCDDGDACTKIDMCTKGICNGVPLNCNDGNNCTADACSSAAGCVYKPIQGKVCDDDDACTSGDLCVDATCTGTPKACDDGKSCTLDGCVKATGACVHTPAKDDTHCPDDGVACTLDRCLNATCTHHQVAASFCLIQGTCLSGGAMHPAKQCFGCQPKSLQTDWSILPGKLCNDGNACTEKSVCQSNGACLGAPKQCNDGNVCTLDACNPQAPGADPCLHTPSKGGCNDGSDCTEKDSCHDTTCKGLPIVCNDGDPCTDDGCLATGGCIFQSAVDGKACADDGLPCTADTCGNGSCTHVPSKGWCAIAGTCYKDGTKTSGKACMGCNSGIKATDWSGLTGDVCDDGDPCTGADACASGVCKGDKSKACNDDNVCTADSCGAKGGCLHIAQQGKCEDGNPCTQKDSCAGGKCVAGPPMTCLTTPKDEAVCQVNVCLPTAGGCSKVSSCGALHACVAGLCLTQPAGKPPGPVTVPLPVSLAPQPLRPVIAWQESHTATMGNVPQLWIAAQTAGCSPNLGVYSKIALLQFAPNGTKPVVSVVQTKAPTGSGGWCAAHPVIAAHPTTYDALALTWLEGGNEKSACPWTKHGGRSRTALIGVQGQHTVMTAGAPCPAAGPLMPLSWRPAVALHTAQGSIGKTSPGQMAGVLVRPATAGGLLAWGGDVVANWGGNKAAILAPGKLLGWSETPTKSRAAISEWLSGQVIWNTTSYANGSGKTIPALTATRVDSITGLAKTTQVVLTGAPVSGAATYDAVEAAYDASSKRVAVLIGGRAVSGGKTHTFLAFKRVHPNQGATSSPAAIAVAQLAGNQGSIQAFRLARFPNSDKFLVVWASPGSTILQAVVINPKDDHTFTVTSIGALASDFVSHPVVGGIDSSGGLSDLVIDPSGTRFSIAYESVGTLQLLTAALPSTK
ncbi:MAG: hypothetical protein KC502_18755 [Myxococcales bacterium]|nr:hypothetical protein [Myxococcales bacterium]